MKLIREWLPRVQAAGTEARKLEVGALNQIALLHDAARYPDFEIRNIAGNGVIWDGAGGTIDVAGVQVRRTKRDRIPENRLSTAIRIRYGAFSYYSGGDNELTMIGADGRKFNWEQMIGQMVGPVSVAKTNHHAGTFGMTPEFVQEVRAKVYLSSVWQARMVDHKSLQAMCSRELYAGDRLVCFGEIAESRRNIVAAYGTDIAQGGHAVVKVAPGGTTFRVYTLTTQDESMRILDVRNFVA